MRNSHLTLLFALIAVSIIQPAKAAQAESQVVAQQPILKSATEIIQINSVRINSVANNIEVILETKEGAKLQVNPTKEGNSYIADIPNAQLTNEFLRQDKPIAGITAISVSNLTSTSIRVQITGEGKFPQIELFDGDEGLIFSVAPVVSVAPEAPPQKPELQATNPDPDEAAIELVVTSDAKEEEDPVNQSRNVTVVTREQIEQQTVLTRNLAEVLGKTVPGLGLPTGGGNPGSRFRGRDLVVLVDGVPQSSNRGGGRELRNIDPGIVERVEVIRGTSAAYGSGATGAVINIITRQSSQGKIRYSSSFGVNGSTSHVDDSLGGYLQQSISGKTGNIDFTLNGSIEGAGSYFDAAGSRIPPDPQRQGGSADSRTVSLFGKLGLDLGNQQRLQLSVNRFAGSQNTEYTNDPSVNSIPGRQKARTIKGLVLDTPQEYNNTQVNLQYFNPNVLGSQVQSQLFYRNQQTRQIPFNDTVRNIIRQSDLESEKFGTKLQIRTPLSKNNALGLSWGLDYNTEKSSETIGLFDRASYQNSGGLVFKKTSNRTWIPQINQSNLGLFGQINWRVSDALSVNAGIRNEQIRATVGDFITLGNVAVKGGDLNRSATVFNAGTTLNLSNQVSLFASFNQGFSFTDIGRILRDTKTSIAINQLNPEPQKVDNYEIGIRGKWSNLQASVSGFYSKSDLGSTFDTDTLVVIRAPERIYGIEATVDTQVSKDWNLGGTATWSEGEIDIARSGNYTSLDGYRISPLKVSAYIENQTLPGWNNRLQLFYSGNRSQFGNSTKDGELPVSSFLTLDYLSSVKLGSGKLQVGIENLLNNQYFPVSSQLRNEDATYAAARGRTLSLKYSFDW